MRLTECLTDIGNLVQYSPRLAHFLGSVKAALFLCQLIYWEGKEDEKNNGWIYKTRDQFILETALSRTEQENARKLLRDKGYLLEKKQGCPRKIFFKVDHEKLDKEWDEWAEQNPPSKWYRSNRQDGEFPTDQSADSSPPSIHKITSESISEDYKQRSRALAKKCE